MFKDDQLTEARGCTPHKSAKDESDDQDVITVSYHTASGTRVMSIHAHDDDTWNEFLSRNANKGKATPEEKPKEQ